MKTVISTPKAPPPSAPTRRLSVKAAPLYLSGQIGMVPATVNSFPMM